MVNLIDMGPEYTRVYKIILGRLESGMDPVEIHLPAADFLRLHNELVSELDAQPIRSFTIEGPKGPVVIKAAPIYGDRG